MTATPPAGSDSSDWPLPLAVTVSADRIMAIVRDVVDVEIEDPSSALVSSGIIDSLALVSLLVALEREFSIMIDVSVLDLADLESVERITEFVNDRLSNANNSPSDAKTNSS